MEQKCPYKFIRIEFDARRDDGLPVPGWEVFYKDDDGFVVRLVITDTHLDALRFNCGYREDRIKARLGDVDGMRLLIGRGRESMDKRKNQCEEMGIINRFYPDLSDGDRGSAAHAGLYYN